MKRSKQIIYYCACILVGLAAFVACVKLNGEERWPLLLSITAEVLAIILTTYGLIRKTLSVKSLPMLVGCMVAILGWYRTGAGFAIGMLFVPPLEWMLRKMKWSVLTCIASVVVLTSMAIIYISLWNNLPKELPILLIDTTTAVLSIFLLGNMLIDFIKERCYRQWDRLLTAGLAALIAAAWQYRLIGSLLTGLYGTYFTHVLGYLMTIDFCCLFAGLWYFSDSLRQLLGERKIARALPTIILGVVLAVVITLLSTNIYDGEGRIQTRHTVVWLQESQLGD